MRMPTRQLELPFTAPRGTLAPQRRPAAPATPLQPSTPQPSSRLPSARGSLNAAWHSRMPARPPASILLRPAEGPTP